MGVVIAQTGNRKVQFSRSNDDNNYEPSFLNMRVQPIYGGMDVA